MNRFDLIINHGLVVTESYSARLNIGIKDGIIVQLSSDTLSANLATKTLDATNLTILPGLIDSHVHFNEPGREEWEGFETGSKSLAAGGVTTFFDMPLNSNPPTTTKEAYLLKKQMAEQKSVVHFRLWGGLVPKNVDQLKELQEIGVIGFKAFMSGSGIDEFQACNDVSLLRGMKEIAQIEAILAIHAESEAITNFLADSFSPNQKVSGKEFSESRPIISEIEAVQKLITYAKITGCRLHIVHVSSRKIAEVISQAKNEGLDITMETCPHYLSLTTDDIDEKGAIAKCCPPLRERAEVDSLWKSIIEDEIDIIGSDHSPSTPELKQGELLQAWGGISGAQTTLHVLLTEGYHKRDVSLERIVQLTSTNPAKRFQLFPQKGTIAVGSDADLTIIDPHSSFMLKREDLFYKHKHSPYIGKTLRGTVHYTLVDGNIVHSL
ncbi:allantoinase AllB [Bacillus sp. PS06]|uniref:allantoinase AllB n=1 Tax=Bacillus sp. PS06 TaxID=2764176 RepID=UPI00177A9598|nr:allantoinase AllB [Bacillus sp. PS06]MBD8068001.1 allantoinase AllB [Bacillus sp. PS06]